MKDLLLRNSNSTQLHHFIINGLSLSLIFFVISILLTMNIENLNIFNMLFSNINQTKDLLSISSILTFIIFFSFYFFTIFHIRLGMENIFQDYVHNAYSRQLILFLFDLCIILLTFYIILFF